MDSDGVNLGDLLVPDGIRSVKFSTHLDEPGVSYFIPNFLEGNVETRFVKVVYTSSAGDPLWFTLGKGSDDLIPSGLQTFPTF